MSTSIDLLDTNEKNIIVIGCGQIGSRYIQGLAGMNIKTQIHIVDKSNQAIDLCKKRLEEIKENKNQLRYFNSFPQNVKEYNTAIIATTSSGRYNIIKELNKCYKIDSWIVEKVLAQSTQEIINICAEIGLNKNAFVNTPMRIMEDYKKVKKEIFKFNSRDVHSIDIEGGGWGMACNSIHYIDLISWWMETNVSYIDSNEIESWKESKRKGFIEAFGKLKIYFCNGVKLNLNCSEEFSELKIIIKTTNGNWIINEESGIMISPKDKEINVKLEFQSSMTGPLIEKLISKRKCDLPHIIESSVNQIKMIESFITSFNNIYGKHNEYINIT